jgi:hypothetical protein
MFIANTINKLVFDVTCPDEPSARQVQHEIAFNTSVGLEKLIDEILVKEFDGNEQLLIEKIEIDLGNITIEDLGSYKIRDFLKRAFEDIITFKSKGQGTSEGVRKFAFPQAELQMTLAFLLNGSFPWWVDSSAAINHDEILKKLIGEKPEAIKTFLLDTLNTNQVVNRLINEYKRSTLSEIDVLIPGLIDGAIKKVQFSEDEYHILFAEFSLKILHKLKLLLAANKISTVEKYQSYALRKLLRQPHDKWNVCLRLLNTIPDREIATLNLILNNGRVNRNKNKKEQALHILKKLSLFQVEFLLHTNNIDKFETINLEDKWGGINTSSGNEIELGNIEVDDNDLVDEVFKDKEDRRGPKVNGSRRALRESLEKKKETDAANSILNYNSVERTGGIKEEEMNREGAATEALTSINNRRIESQPFEDSELKHFPKPPRSESAVEHNLNHSESPVRNTSLVTSTNNNTTATDFSGERNYDRKANNQRSLDENKSGDQFMNKETVENYKEVSNEEFVANNKQKKSNSDGIRHNQKRHSLIKYIKNKLSESNEVLDGSLNLLDSDHLVMLQASFKRLDSLIHKQKKIINEVVEHPYFLKYNLLKIIAGTYSLKSINTIVTSEVVEKKSKKKDLLSVLFSYFQSAKIELLETINRLPVTEATVLQDVLKKQLWETEDEKKIIKKVVKKLPDSTIRILHFFIQLPDEELHRLLSSSKKSIGDTGILDRRVLGSKESTKIQIVNAGLCIIASYFPIIFNRLQYLENGLFKNKAIASRALYLIQYITTGKAKSPEYLLQFNKLLCGFRVEENLLTNIRLTKKERSEGDDLLQSVINNWETIKNTSVNGFRGSFLQRKGILTESELGWSLQVERKGYDVLLGSVSWGFSIIKLPWMKKHIQVEW